MAAWAEGRLVICYVVEGSWARISAQIYNERGDYEKLAEAVLMLQTEEPPPQAAS